MRLFISDAVELWVTMEYTKHNCMWNSVVSNILINKLR